MESGSQHSPMLAPAMHDGAVVSAISQCTYVGIDFGTSTTVVSVIAAQPGGSWQVRALQLEQSDTQGIFTEQSLVNTVLAWHNDRLIFGLPAYKLKAHLVPGQNYFSSFKMELGVSVPTYPHTKLTRTARLPYAIETAADAARVFFDLLLPAVRRAVSKEGLPQQLKFAVSVPASFQSCQRHELLECLRHAGIDIAEGCLIDEPNAAFISFLRQAENDPVAEDHQDLLERIYSAAGAQILVYDFGAGTCDVSVLSVSSDKNGVKSTNRSISRFTALGGDNIDREIARHVLLRQMTGRPLDELKENFIEERALPRLTYTAEQLKIAMLSWIAKMGYDSPGQLQFVDHRVTGRSTEIYNNAAKGIRITIAEPSLEMPQFLEVMERFVGENPSPELDVCAPVKDALTKAKMSAKDLDAVLFIGGSCENPLVRRRVMQMMPSSVHAVVPRDLREHVSLGAALHSLCHHGFGVDCVTPITSEDIYVITRGYQLEPLITASTPVPTGDLTATFMVADDRQEIIEIPICRGSPDVILGILTMTPGDGGYFKQGEHVRLVAAISRDKDLTITALAAGRPAVTEILSPLAQRRLSEADEKYLRARRAYNEALLRYGARNLPQQVILDLAKVCARNGRSAEAAELYEQLYTLFRDKSVLTDICYQYSRAGRSTLRSRWAKVAAEQHPTPVNLYNYAIELDDRPKRAEMLRQALSINPDFNCALIALGNQLKLMSKSADGEKYLRRAYKNLQREFLTGFISAGDVRLLLNLAESFGDETLANACREFLHKRDNRSDSRQNGFSDANLLVTDNHPRLEG